MTPPPPEDPPAGPGPDAHTREVDRAALLGAALAAVVALTFGGQGEWDYLAAAAGVALLAVLGAFFRLPRGRGRAGRLAEVGAMSAVAALAAALVVAAPMQAVLATGTPDGRACRAGAAVSAGFVLIDEQRRRAAALAADRLAGEGATTTAAEALVHAAEHEHRTVLGVCLGALTSRWLPLPALAIGLTIFGVASLRLRRRDRRDRRGSQPPSAVPTRA
jgi:hypothetical protein